MDDDSLLMSIYGDVGGNYGRVIIHLLMYSVRLPDFSLTSRTYSGSCLGSVFGSRQKFLILDITHWLEKKAAAEE